MRSHKFSFANDDPTVQEDTKAILEHLHALEIQTGLRVLVPAPKYKQPLPTVWWKAMTWREGILIVMLGSLLGLGIGLTPLFF